MAELDLETSHRFWRDYEDPIIYRVVAFMESMEDWTFDGDENLEALISEFSNKLTTLKNFELEKEEEFIALSCHIKMTRILRLLQAIDTVDPGSASKLLMYAEENSSAENPRADMFLRRNIIFERLRLLTRVFSDERFNVVMNALEGSDD
jgi:intracellular multiplication protein IcmW